VIEEPLGSAIWDFLTLIITLLPKLGARAVNILAALRWFSLRFTFSYLVGLVIISFALRKWR
jgi:hypothetical protein